MGSIISAIKDDIKDYERLCKKYKEEPCYKADAYGNKLLDCYGEHASRLANRERQERTSNPL